MTWDPTNVQMPESRKYKSIDIHKSSHAMKTFISYHTYLFMKTLFLETHSIANRSLQTYDIFQKSCIIDINGDLRCYAKHIIYVSIYFTDN